MAWRIIRRMWRKSRNASQLLNLIFEPGFFTSEPVRTALAIGGGAAIVSAVIGVFTVMRGYSFAGHALADVSSAGGSASFLFGINPLLGFLGMAAAGAGALELMGATRAREHDLVTGIVLGAGLGLTALFLYLDVTTHSTTGAAISVMFGSMFAIPASILPLALGVCATALALAAFIYRPLLLSVLDADLAYIRGVNVRLVSLLHLLALAMAVALSSMTVGAILSTALLIGPAVIALRIAKHPAMAVALAALFGLSASWIGILLAYDSFYWTPGHGWPVSFFIVALIFLGYLLSVFWGGGSSTRRTA